MSLRFYFGPSGAGKSRQVYKEMIRRSSTDFESAAPRKIFILVPDQFTLQTQEALVELHDRGGIWNIDVLSFGRLAYRIFSETGGQNIPVLDDVGKSLVLQKVASDLHSNKAVKKPIVASDSENTGSEDESKSEKAIQLQILGSHLKKQGYIHEIKSALSEFMQYGISPDDMNLMVETAAGRGALSLKLRDLQILYRSFKDYISGHFITTEETLDVLGRSLRSSQLIKDSIVVFDGFTGFTPIQERVIQEIMVLAEEVVITVTMGVGENPFQLGEMQELFYLSKKTVSRLTDLALRAGVERGTDVFILPANQDNAANNSENADQENNTDMPNAADGSNAAERLYAACRTNAPIVNVAADQKDNKLKIVNTYQHRFIHKPALAALERELFRQPALAYEGEQDSIRLWEASSPREEVHQAGLLLLTHIRSEGMAFRDIGIIVGDMESYAPYVEREFTEMEIPFYLDRTRGIGLNPLIECIKSALGMITANYSREAVFRYLRSGLTDITPREADVLEDYVLQTGIRGYKRWSNLFTRKTKGMGEDESILTHINAIRSRLIESVASLSTQHVLTVKEHVACLYAFLLENKVQDKLHTYELDFKAKGDTVRTKEFSQIYPLVMDLLDQIYQLLGEEEISLREFADILDAGFSEIQVGTIPQSVDRVIVGDMERTRLKQVKVLFFLGVNDGNIPPHGKTGGILSDMDREFLHETGMELAPTPREQMFIQRLYLYMNVTKPSHVLYLSYARVNREGKALRPSYFIDVVRKLFPVLKVTYPQMRPLVQQVVTSGEGLHYLAQELREYAAGRRDPKRDGYTEPLILDDAETIHMSVQKQNQTADFFALYQAYSDPSLTSKRHLFTQAAFRRYRDSALSKAVAQALFGMKIGSTTYLENTVSRLETYAACAYHHFLTYGLSLEERREFRFEASDMGNVFHEVLAGFAGKLQESQYTWFDFPPEFGEKTVEEVLTAYAANYGATILYDNARNVYAISRMKRILVRTILTLQVQLKRGTFQPEAYEISFAYAGDLESVNLTLSPFEKMRLKGRIDRIDISESQDKVYVKVIDYKSGNHQFDLAALYYGLQLQLVVYMNAALELEAKKHPDKDIIPGALLYYHMDDPTVEAAGEPDPEELNRQLLRKLRMTGVVNSEEDVISRLDHTMADKSDIIPVSRKKDGTYTAQSSIMSGGDLKLVSSYVNEKVKEIGKEILAGEISLNPYEMQSAQAPGACDFCPYQKTCGFDPSLPGQKSRELPDMSRDEAMLKIENYLMNATHS
jgi:ATP-dependent helicase/nuclease subunit B